MADSDEEWLEAARRLDDLPIEPPASPVPGRPERQTAEMEIRQLLERAGVAPLEVYGFVEPRLPASVAEAQRYIAEEFARRRRARNREFAWFCTGCVLLCLAAFVFFVTKAKKERDRYIQHSSQVAPDSHNESVENTRKH